MDFDKAIDVHVEWKTKLRGAIAAQSKLDAAVIGKDNVCPLGQWLHGDAKIKYGHLPAFTGCVSAHAVFHREASRVAAMINDMRYTDADAALGAGTPYTSASVATGVAIGKLRKEVGA